MNTITFDINNKQTMLIAQGKHDGDVKLIISTAGTNEESKLDVISAGDMVMLMNYYRYQKEHNEPIF